MRVPQRVPSSVSILTNDWTGKCRGIEPLCDGRIADVHRRSSGIRPQTSVRRACKVRVTRGWRPDRHWSSRIQVPASGQLPITKHRFQRRGFGEERLIGPQWKLVVLVDAEPVRLIKG